MYGVILTQLIGPLHWTANVSHCTLKLLILTYCTVFLHVSPHVAPQATLARRRRRALASTATSSCCSSNLHKHQWRSASVRSHLAVTPPRHHAVNREPSVVSCLLSQSSSNYTPEFQWSCVCGWRFLGKLPDHFLHLSNHHMAMQKLFDSIGLFVQIKFLWTFLLH